MRVKGGCCPLSLSPSVLLLWQPFHPQVFVLLCNNSLLCYSNMKGELVRELQGELDDWGGVGGRRNLCLRASLKHNPLSSGKCPWSLSSVLGTEDREWKLSGRHIKSWWDAASLKYSFFDHHVRKWLQGTFQQFQHRVNLALDTFHKYKKWSRDNAHSFHTTEAWLVTLTVEEWKIRRGLHKSLPWSFPEHKGSYGRREPKISNYLFNDHEFNVITYLMIIFIKLDIVLKSTVIS